ncbi:MAG: response regulator [Hyphomonadaceae bacterium]
MSGDEAAGAGSVARIRGLKILIVEDEPFFAFDLIMAIEDAGAIAVGPAASVAEAIDFLHSATPDAAIVDVHLPDGTIAAFLDAIPKGLPVVVHTGIGLPEDIAARHPDMPVVLKPTDPAVLLQQIGKRLKAI